MVFNDAICGSQPQSRTFTNFFGSEKWLKNSFNRILVHSDPAVRNGKLYKISPIDFKWLAVRIT